MGWNECLWLSRQQGVRREQELHQHMIHDRLVQTRFWRYTTHTAQGMRIKYIKVPRVSVSDVIGFTFSLPACVSYHLRMAFSSPSLRNCHQLSPGLFCLESHTFFLFLLFSFWCNKFSSRRVFLTNSLLDLNFFWKLQYMKTFLHTLLIVWLTVEF